MTFTTRLALGLLSLSAALACQAQAPGAARTPGSATASAASSAAQAASGAARQGDTSVQHTVIEDEGTRIEETRQRGAARRIVVRSKVPGVRDYEIQVAPGGRDPAQERGGAGQRAWSLFSF